MRHSVLNEHSLVGVPATVGSDGIEKLHCLIKPTKLPQNLNGEKFIAPAKITVAEQFKQALKVLKLFV